MNIIEYAEKLDDESKEELKEALRNTEYNELLEFLDI